MEVLMRLGGPVFPKQLEPDLWITALQARGYRAAYCPANFQDSAQLVQGYAQAASQAGILIAETGAWSNPLSPDEPTRQAALLHCQQQLHLADEIGALCCVNISGSRSQRWDGPHHLNLSQETFEQIVESVRKIIDAVRPKRTFYTLEPMPWMYPDSADSYLALIQAIDRPQFAVHFDPANLICSPQRYYGNARLIQEFFEKLGPYIKSCHAKDVRLGTSMTVHLEEVRPGLGELDYPAFLKAANRANPDLPLMMEHLETEQEYDLAAAYLKTVARDNGESL
jgi:sugar phosphate isomerase/epimerase